MQGRGGRQTPPGAPRSRGGSPSGLWRYLLTAPPDTLTQSAKVLLVEMGPSLPKEARSARVFSFPLRGNTSLVNLCPSSKILPRSTEQTRWLQLLASQARGATWPVWEVNAQGVVVS